MPGLDPGIHVSPDASKEVVDGRERRQVYVVCAKQTTMPGHDENTHTIAKLTGTLWAW